MPKKLILRVRPGVALTCATFASRRELIRLDLPTLERPRNAISGGPGAGNCSRAVADLMNLLVTFTCIHLLHAVFQIKSQPQRTRRSTRRTDANSFMYPRALCGELLLSKKPAGVQ